MKMGAGGPKGWGKVPAALLKEEQPLTPAARFVNPSESV